VQDDRVYVGIGDAQDSPIQNGKVVAVDLNTGHIMACDGTNCPGTKCQWTGYAKFNPLGPRIHGDTGYRQPGAAWGDVFIVKTGGESLVQDGVIAGYSRLHALNACATSELDRVRWIFDVPNTSGGPYSFGAPTVTGGIVFIGTDQGNLVVFGDPSVVPAAGVRCSNIDYTTETDCIAAGYSMVTIPAVLANVRVPDLSSIAGLRGEPVLANGRVYVSSVGGHVYMLEP
jgi:outer membrane protein assembly factor BamB